MNGAFLHLAVNHIPVVGLPIAFLLLAAGVLRKSRDLIQAGCVTVVLVALSIFVVYKSGGAAAHIVRDMIGVTRETIHTHAEAGEDASIGVVVLGVGALISLWLLGRPKGLPNALTALLLAGTLGVSLWLGYVAHLGGLIRHPEIETGVLAPPAGESPMTWKRAAALVLIAGISHAELKGKTIEYQEGSTVLEGYLVYDAAVQGKRPGVVVVPDWMGMSPFARDRADALAGMGYIALAADVYGKGIRPKDAAEAMALVKTYKSDRPLLRARAQAAWQTLLDQPQTDPQRVAAMGYCFGGTTALELARSGVPLAGVVTFHGSLDTPHPEDARNIKAKVLALHGADDPFVPPEQVAAFEKEMTDAKVDWQLVKYSGAVHAFAVPTAGNDPSKGVAYNEKAARRAWQAMKLFFDEILK